MKKLIFTITISILSVIIIINKSEGQWVETGPYSAEYSKSTASENSIYINSNDFSTGFPSIIKSTDGGIVWNNIGTFMDLGCTSLNLVDNYLFRGTYGGSISRTSNDGIVWEDVSNGLAQTGGPVKVIEKCNGFLLTTVDASGIFKSTNNGENWIDVNSSLTITSGINDFTSNGTNVFAADVYRFIYRANSSGENWIVVLDNPALSFNDLIYFESEIFVSTTSSGILKSSDNGNNWNFVNNGLLNLSVTSMISSGTNLFASTQGGGVFLSTNNGGNWIPVINGLHSLNVYDLFYCNAKLFAGSRKYGLFFSTNNGYDWIKVNARIKILSPTSFISNQSFVFASCYEGIFRTSDNGNSWILSDRGIENRYGEALAVKDNFVFYGTPHNGLYRSSDNGNLWVQINNEFINTKVSALTSNSEYLIAGFYPQRLYRSSNNGENWTQINNGFTANQVNQLISSGSDLYVGSNSGVFYSSNNGSNWRNTGLNSFVLDLDYNGMYLFALMQEGIYRSSNNGSNWTLIYNNQPEPTLFSLESSGSNIFAGGLDNILYSRNNGLDWITINEGFPPQQPFAHNLFISGDYIFAEREYYPVSKRQLHEITHQSLNDVGITTIHEPLNDSVYQVDCINSNIIIPKVNITNHGTVNQNNFFDVHFEIKQGDNLLYSSVKQDTISSGQTHTLSFDPYTIAFDFGTYNLNLKSFSMKSWTSLSSDTNHANDTLSSAFTVNNPNYGYSDISGYYFLNSSSNADCIPDQPVFHWEDTTGSVNLITNGTLVVPYTDYNSFYFSGCFRLPDVLPDGNKFKFFGTCYDTIVIATNGIIGLGGSMTGMNIPFPVSIPSASAPKPAIFPFWYWCNFLDPEITGRNLKYKVTADKFIITYDRVPIYNTIINSQDYLSYQVILEIGPGCGIDNGKIRIQFDDSKSGSYFLNNYYNGNLNANTVGIQNASGTVGIQYRRSDSPGNIPVTGPLFGSPMAIEFGQINELLPVELAGFTSAVSENNVTLNWQTNLEINNSGFSIERSAMNDQWSSAGFVKGNGNTNAVTSYTFTDKDLAPGKYIYRLKQIDYNGSFEYFDLKGEVNIGVPDKYELSQNYPNPFNPVTKLEYGIPEQGLVTLKVYDILGKEIKTLVKEIKPAGRYRVEFDGSSFASGIYFYEIHAGNFVSQKRMLLLK